MTNQRGRKVLYLLATATAYFAFGVMANAQTGGAGSGSSAAASGMAAGTAAKNSTQVGRDMSQNNPEIALEIIRPVERKEQKAYDSFKSVPLTDPAAKIKAGEKFLNEYPKSELVAFVYPYLVVGYIQLNQMPKAMDAAKRDFDVNPKDFRTMSVLSQTLARTYNPSAPDADKQLSRAEEYGKKAMDGVTTFTQPEGMTDDAFAQWKKETNAMAHSGVGLVALRQNKYPEAIVEIEKAIALNDLDQTNFYLLGVANMNSDHASEAAKAFAKCAAIQGNLQSECAKAEAMAKKTN